MAVRLLRWTKRQSSDVAASKGAGLTCTACSLHLLGLRPPRFAEFKSHKGAGVPIVRTKQLEETTIAFTGEAPAGSGDEEKQIVFTFQGGVVEALEQGSQSLSRALAMVATQGSPGELPKDGYEGRRGLSELASIVANLLTMAIEAAAGQCQDQPSESFPETSSESIGTEGVS